MVDVVVVLLLDEVVVVFLVGAAPCEGDSVFGALADHLMVLELTAVVRVKSFERVGKS